MGSFPMDVAVLLGALSPYHLARMAAVERLANKGTWRFTTVERVGYSPDHPFWGGVARSMVTVLSAYPEGNPTPKTRESADRLINALEAIGPDCVVFGRSSAAYFAVLEWCLVRKIPTVLLSDSTAFDQRRFAWKEAIKRRIVSLFSSGFVAGTRQLEYMVALGMREEVIVQGYDVVDNAYFSELSDDIRANADINRIDMRLPSRYFLVANRMIEVKNLLRLLRAYSIYISRAGGTAWRLVVVGDGPMRAACEKAVKEHGLEDWVQFEGYRGYKELPGYYALASAFILASASETWGLVVNEAMAAGLPVLVSERCGCSPDLVRPGINGFVFDPFDVNALASCMIKLSSGEVDLGAMGKASRAIIADWTPERFAIGLIAAVERAIAAPQREIGLVDRLLLKALCLR